MYKSLYYLVLLIVSFRLSATPTNTQAVLYNGTGTTADNKLIAMTLAGIVNRTEPRLYLLNVYETWSYNQTDEMWRDIYAAEGKTAFTVLTDINELVQFFIDDIAGAITYNPALTYGNFEGQNFRWQGEVAAMIGGLSDCIPIPFTNTSIQIQRPDSVLIHDHFHGKDPVFISAKLELPAHGWNNEALTQEKRYFNLLDWALDNLLNYTNPEKFYIREITDWAVSQRMFQLNLAGTESLQFASLTAEKAEKIERVMTYMQNSNPGKIFHVYGWMRPEPLVQWISGWGGSFHETLLSNLSWHHVFPVDESFQYNRPSALSYDDVVLQDKYYILILGSEGDAGNWNAGFQSGAWHSATRGQVPVGWGFNLHFFREFPFIAQYYYKTATPNDGFMAVTTPLGYAYTDMFPENYLADAREQTSWKIDQYNIPTTYAYKHYNGAGVSTYRNITISNNYNFHKLGAFAESTGTELTILFDPGLATQKAYTQYGSLLYNHVNDDTFYADVTDLNITAQRITGKLNNKPRPAFLLAGYQRFRQDGTTVGPNNKADITLPRIRTLMDLVQADEQIGKNVEFVTPEQFTWLLKKSIENVSVSNTSILDQPQMFAYSNGSGIIKVNIELTRTESLQISVYDLSGKIIYRKSATLTQGNNSLDIDFHNISKGIYLLNVSGLNFFINQKFVY
jgi:hypothetical protein